MYTLLAVAVLISMPSIGSSYIYTGRGDFYFTLTDKTNESDGVRVVFRPTLSQLYLNSNFQAYLGFNSNVGLATGLGWTLMSYDSVGQYYYADHIRSAPITNQPLSIVYSADIFRGDDVIYQEKVRYLMISQYSTYCELDSKKRYDSEFTCSQALDSAYITKTTTNATTMNNNMSTAGATVLAIAVTFVILLLALAVYICWRIRNKIRENTHRRNQEEIWAQGSQFIYTGPRSNVSTARRVRSNLTIRDGDLEQPISGSHDRSHGRSSNRSQATTDLPPPYTIAVQSSLPDYSVIMSQPNSQDPKTSLEQPPSYELAVANFSTYQINSYCTSTSDSPPLEHSGDSLTGGTFISPVRENRPNTL